MKLKKAFPLTFFLLLLVTFAYATGSKDALLYESFEAEWNTSSPWGPVGWSESAVASGTVIGDSDWDRDDNSNAIEGEYIAYMSQTSDPTDDWLITPVIDLTSNAGTDYLEYYIRIRYGLTAGDYLYIMISTDGGTSWSILKTYDSTNTDELSDYPLTRQVVDLTAYNDQSNVKLGFYGDYNDAYKLKLYLDCVKVDVYTAPDPVTTPDPEDAATGVAPDYTLGWAVSAMATSYDVYLGTDQTAVTNATNASPEFKGNQAGTTYTPSSNFDYNTQYSGESTQSMIMVPEQAAYGYLSQYPTQTTAEEMQALFMADTIMQTARRQERPLTPHIIGSTLPTGRKCTLH